MSRQISTRFLEAGHQAIDYAVGLKYAQEQGWIEAADQSQLRLTEVGFAEI
jgi:hypothetical protein